ncbi:MAG: hypothetical protein AB7O52_11440 [Planctomycetota bacterium]
MEPLASLGPVAPVPPIPSAAVLRDTADRDRPAHHAAGHQRPVELATRRLDPTERTAGQRRAQNGTRTATSPPDRSTIGLGDPEPNEPAGTQRAERVEEREPRASAETEVEVEVETQPRRGFTYSIYPELRVRFQSQIIDRETAETIRSVPSESRIELARRFEEHIGSQLDVYA